MYIRQLAAVMLLSGVCNANIVAQTLEPPQFTQKKQTNQVNLTQFVQSAVERNPMVQAALSRLDASTSYQSAAARPLYNPELEIAVEDTDIETRTIGVKQTIDWSGKRTARKSVATAERLIVEATYQLTRRKVAKELLTGLANYQVAEERTSLADEREDLMEQFRLLAKKRFETGDLSKVEFNLANLVMAEAQIKLATAKSELADARQILENLVPVDSQMRWPSLQTPLAQPKLLAQPEETLEELPEVNVARNQLYAAMAKVSLRQREKRMDPTIGVTGGDEGGESLLGISLSVPLPVRNRFQHEVTAAMAEQSQAGLLLQDVLYRAKSRMSNSFERYQITYIAWQQWLELGQESLQFQIEELERLWSADELSTTDFLVQMGQSLDNQDSALDLKLTLWQSWFEWQAASGILDEWLNSSPSSTLSSEQLTELQE
ncbi:MAG: TolC family protein [Acidiferrobacterales bacterium]|nr:TolC family protein [Acidiferrobacterales bacterium]